LFTSSSGEILGAVAGVSCALYVAVLLALARGLSRLTRGSNSTLRSVSVIVAAKNEEENLPRCLQALVEQDYPVERYQIIVVDDHSSDGTRGVAEYYARHWPQVSVLAASDTRQGLQRKQRALATGIAAARHEILLFTDADCQPPRRWIRTMVSHWEEGVGLVAGFAPVVGRGLWGKVLAIDTLAAAVVAAGSIGWGKTATCTGRSLAYRREVYEEADGFNAFGESVSGDDDLLLHQVRHKTPWRIRYAIEPEGFVPSDGVVSWRDFVKQKRRHLSAGRFYPLSVKAVYLFMHGANVLLWGYLLTALALRSFVVEASVLFVLKIAADFVALKRGAHRFRQPIGVGPFLLWEVFFVAYNLLLGPLSFVGKIRWRE